MKSVWVAIIALAVINTSFLKNSLSEQPPTLSIGSKAPDFKLLGTDGKMYSLANFGKAKILVIVFTCNHCPTAQAYEDRIIKLTEDYKDKGVQVLAINPNDPTAIRLDELGYTDLSDSFEEMKIRYKNKHFNFPYLYDGKNQAASKAYGPSATPHVFILDKNRILRYQGRIDDMEKPSKTPSSFDVRAALDQLLLDKEVTIKTTKVFGCSIKWAEKSSWITEYKEKWAKETVVLNTIDEAGVKELLKNNSDKLRLINIWASWCGPCVAELPDFINMNRMYRDRDFEFISISADDPSAKPKVEKFVKKLQASGTNYLFTDDNKYKLIEAIDPAWQGALPYTILVEPGGKIVYRKQGKINVIEMKKSIVDDPYMGRFYK